MKTLFSIIASLFITFSVTSQDFILFENETFTSPFSGGVVGTSPVEFNNSGFNSVRVVIKYNDITPDVCDCQVFAVLEEEIADGVWVASANQFEAYQREGVVPTRIIELSPQFNSNEGVDYFVDVPTGAIRISKTSNVAPSSFRIRFFVTEYSEGALQSLSISVYGKKFNTD